MSRCFPFPPPGYESKNRPEDLDILKEATHKEKRHKKEKKDKERTKDKKEKDGSDDKQRDKKDGKEEHKDKKEKQKDKDKKKKKKDRSKVKEKTSTSVESTVSAKLGEKSGKKFHPKEHNKPKNTAVHEGGVSVKLGEKSGEKFHPKEHNKPRNSAVHGGDPVPFQTHSQSSLHLISKETDESRFVRELDRRIRDDEDRKSQLPERIPNLHNRDQETSATAAVSSFSKIHSEEKGNNKDNRVDCAKMDLDSLRNKFDISKVVQNLIPVSESKVEEFPRPPERRNEWRLEGKYKYKETGESKGKDKKKDGDKKSHGNEKVKEKENKKEKAKVKSERDMLKVVGKNDFVGVGNSNISKDSPKDVSRTTEGNIRKRKDIDTNGFLPEIKSSPNKRHRPAPHESTVNGSIPEGSSGTPSKASKPEEGSRTPSKSSYDMPTVHNYIHAVKKERLINGIITQVQKHSPSKPNLLAPIVVTDRTQKPVHESISLNEIVERQIAESSRRPPHPDSKYLADVLSVPTVMNVSEIDNDEQEWLFSKRVPSDKRVGAKEELCVWSEAVHIESADVCAMPYVIPY